MPFRSLRRGRAFPLIRVVVNGVVVASLIRDSTGVLILITCFVAMGVALTDPSICLGFGNRGFDVSSTGLLVPKVAFVFDEFTR